MPPGKESGFQTSDSPQRPAKRQKCTQRSRTPPEFWDNLSRIPLCRRALREFNRRNTHPAVPTPRARSLWKEDQLKQLKRFGRHGGPNLRDIRGYPVPLPNRSQMKTDPSAAQQGPTPKPTISSKDPAFEQGLIDAGYYPIGHHRNRPKNMEELKRKLAERRPSLSPSVFSDDKFQNFEQLNDEASSEAFVRSRVFPIIEGNPQMPSGQDQVFNHVDPLANGLSMAKPDYYFGSRPTELDRRVREDLAKNIIPCNNTSRPLLPNHFTELKGPDGKGSEMKRQITHDLGIGARGMLDVQSYGHDGFTYDGNAYTLGATYHSNDSSLTLYAMHPMPSASPNGRPQYYASRVRTFSMNDDADAFRQGATWYRNSKDVAKEWRDSAIKRANATANATANEDGGASKTPASAACESPSQETVTSLHSNNETVHDGTDTSASSQSRKRPSSRQPRPRPRKRARISPNALRSGPPEFWRFADGQFHCHDGNGVVRSQRNQPHDVWVFSEKGWPGSKGSSWCCLGSDGTTAYR